MNRETWTEREGQWSRFHEWERSIPMTAPLASRLQWFSEAWEIARRCNPPGPGMPSKEKIERIRLFKQAVSRIKVD